MTNPIDYYDLYEEDDPRIECEDCGDKFMEDMIDKLACECWVCRGCQPLHESND